ncbi:hypothetical protein MKW94_019469 [Papaver nudicaule]|uniref:Uncharacterized protein n=1 Tax=Papaver nudicaule TaxID=74823 RepID=A0AA41VZE6_PAPNU|nr:hypothetical protein [Papaver nudicaule]
MEKGSKAMRDGDFAEASDCFSRAVEIKVLSFGELSPECASAYYKYGCALLYKAQEEADPLGSVPKKESEPQQNSDKGSSSKSVIDKASSSASDAQKEDGDSIQNEVEKNDEKDGGCEKEVEDGDEESEDEDVADAEQDEDDSDLDLAWKMLDLARAIAEKNPNDTMEKVDILSALGEVALEREDIDTSLSDYLNALAILQRLVEPDSRQIAELYFRICLVLEVGAKPEEAVPYCEKAISVCKSRVQRLTDEVKNAATEKNVDAAVSESQHSSPPSKEAEIENLNGLSGELEKKLEDLQQLVLHPTSILADVLNMVSSRAAGNDTKASTTVFSSSQKAVDNSGGDINSPTVSTAHTNGSSAGVTHLGVVGRGAKRVLLTPENVDARLAKKPSLELNSENGEGSCP